MNDHDARVLKHLEALDRKRYVRRAEFATRDPLLVESDPETELHRWQLKRLDLLDEIAQGNDRRADLRAVDRHLARWRHEFLRT